MNLNKLRDKAYQCAVAHGWHEENLSDEHFLCLVISELMEAVEADRKGKHADTIHFNQEMDYCLRELKVFGENYDKAFIDMFEYYIKDSVEDELSDAFIRLLDLAGLRNVDLSAIQQVEYPFESNETFTEFCFGICKQITSFTPERIGMSVNIHVVLMEIFSYCRAMGIDLLWFIEQKMKYNELRPYKHGNKSY